MSMSQPQPVDQIVPLHGFALRTLLNDKIGGMRISSREAETKTAPSPYVSPQKKPGQLTEKQKESIEDRLRVKGIIQENSKISSREIIPPPPTGAEMNQLRAKAEEVAANLYEDNPVKVVPYASTVLQAYKSFQKDNGPYIQPQVKLPPLYNLYA